MAHCDLKLDNIAVERGKLLLSDLGTSTYATLNGNLRDNMGCVYTRSPRLFAKGSHPEKSSDVFSFGSLFYKMFTGSYALEDEINEATEKGNLDDIMNKLVDTRTANQHIVFSKEYNKLIEEKCLAIPAEFREFTVKCLKEEYCDGVQMLCALNRCIPEYEKKNIRKNIIKYFSKTVLKALAAGSIAAATIIGFDWTKMNIPAPDYNEAVGFHRELELRDFDKTGLTFETERKYGLADVTLGKGNYSIFTTWGYHKERTILEKLVKTWIATAERTKIDYDDRLMRFEYMDRTQNFQNGASIPTNTILECLLHEYCCMLKAHGDTPDLEDVGTALLSGFERFRKAQKTVNSMNFSDYSTAKDSTGEHIIKPEEKTFIEQWCAQVQQELPGHVVIK